MAKLCLCIVFILLLAGCATNQAGDNFTHTIEDWQPEPAGAEREPADIQTYSSPSFGSVLGYNVVSYPNTADLKPERFFTIDDTCAQMVYVTSDNRTLVLWLTRTGQINLSSFYSEPHVATDEYVTIDDIDVHIQSSPTGCYMVRWERDDYQYLLHSRDTQNEPQEAEIHAFVEELACEAVA